MRQSEGGKKGHQLPKDVDVTNLFMFGHSTCKDTLYSTTEAVP